MKRRLVQVFILLFALWPLLHFGLVVRYGVDPWKLFGWGMYSVPGAMKSLRLAVESDQGQLLVIDPETYSTREGRAALRFVEYRRALGRLARPDDLLQVFFEERPELQSIVVGLATLELDPDSGHLVSALAYTHFDRDGRPIPFDPSK
jgi:hypothetical protein